MLIVCEHCQRQLNLPDEKIPSHRFALTCPGCKGRMEVDPEEASAAPAPAPAPAGEEAAGEEAAAAPSSTASGADDGGAGGRKFMPLPPLRELDRELLDHLPRLAGIANPTGGPTAHLEAGLKLLEMDEVRVFDTIEAATEAMLETDLSVLLVVLERATAPPCAPLAPIQRLPLPARRKTFVALMAPNVRNLDGQTAFYLQVNCLLSTQDIPRFPADLHRALVFHLRHYRFWGIQPE